MKNTNKIPSEYDRAIQENRVEYATADGGANRSYLIRFVNIIRGLEMRGIDIPIEKSLDFESLLKQTEAKGIKVPSVPFDRLSQKEQRSFSDSLAGVTIPSVTDNMTERQKALYHTHQMYKNGYTLRNGQWVKMK
jgi:hypothetical protein